MSAALTLKAYRVNSGLSVPQFAEKAGVEPHVIRHAEKTGNMPSEANALRIASAMGVQVTDVWPIEKAAS